jgi:hypothetical protein
MELKRIAAAAVVAGAVGVSIAVGFVDWRMGLGLFCMLLMAGGLASLRSSDG